MSDHNTFYQQIQALNDNARPVHEWDPPSSGQMDCLIKHDGSWFIEGEIVTKQRLVRLFSTILKREGDDYFLVSPVEKWQIQVEDMPFLIVEMTVLAAKEPTQTIQVRTNLDDSVNINTEHTINSSPIICLDKQPTIPYVHIRHGLNARFNRHTYIELADLLTPADDSNHYELLSAGTSFTLAL